MSDDEHDDEQPQRKTVGRPFAPGNDSRRNRKGRPRHLDAFRKLARQVAAEPVIDAKGETITRIESVLRSWAKSKQPALQLAWVAYCYGRPPEKLEVNELKPQTQLILYYGHEREKVEREQRLLDNRKDCE